LRIGKVFNVFAAIAIILACLGLFGLSAYSIQQRTKEIGVRKVLGATVGRIAVLVSAQFIKLVGIAFILASPIAWLLMNRWLEDFAYRVSLNWTIFLFTALVILLIAVITVSFQAIKAAVANPVKSLRTE
jgi:putative ABC transport system permease protein